MAVKYILALRGNPGNPSAKRKYYAQAISVGEVTLNRLSKEISSETAIMKELDVLLVLDKLIKVLNRHLSEGRIVRFGDFGSFQIMLKSEGTETSEEFKNSFLRDARVAFRPSPDIKDMLTKLEFKKI
jgi:predicted histone-like DNA-binding protein